MTSINFKIKLARFFAIITLCGAIFTNLAKGSTINSSHLPPLYPPKQSEETNIVTVIKIPLINKQSELALQSRFQVKFPFEQLKQCCECNVVNISQINRQFTHLHIGEHDIYIPCDGVQPTTEQIANWSCANVSDEGITELYMRMFGWSPAKSGQLPLKFGFAATSGGEPQQLAPIFDTTRQSFWQIIRDIAGSAIGRVLLYRLLIEIRRTNEAGKGSQDQDEIKGAYLTSTRNIARSLKILQEKHCWQFNVPADLSRAAIIFDFSTMPLDMVVTEQLDESGKSHFLTQENEEKKMNTSVVLFHELLHWYQHLRSFQRTEYESDYKKNSFAIEELPRDYGYTNTNCMQVWTREETSIKTKINELRVICGGFKGSKNKYFQGDDISENALRCELNLNMRFGHSGLLKTSDAINDKAIKAAYDNALECVSTIKGTPQSWPNVFAR
jgi:hypothetical protein